MTTTAEQDDERPARFLWLPPFLHPPAEMSRRQERVLLLVGSAVLFGGYDMNIFGMALPQIQQSLNIPENMAGPTISLFRLATFLALLLAMSADLFGRRRLLLITIFGAAVMTILTAFAETYPQFVWAQIGVRVFGYAEEMLCYVTVAEEVSARVRGWSTGTLAAMAAFGAGMASLVFGAVNYLPYGWRALYIIGGLSLFVLAYFRRKLPETRRFEARKAEVRTGFLASIGEAVHGVRRLFTEYPRRVIALVIGVGCFGFANGAAATMMSKYLQQAHGFSPGSVTILFLAGGTLSLIGNFFAGRLSDWAGRRVVTILCALLMMGGYGAFYSGMGGWVVPVAWIVGLMGYLSANAMFAGYPAELFPTAYRATASGLRYGTDVLMGALALLFEGFAYTWFVDHGADPTLAHGYAILLPLALVPIAITCVLFFPETARRSLEDLTEPVPTEAAAGELPHA